MTGSPDLDPCPNCGGENFSFDRVPAGVINIRYCDGCGWPLISDVWAEVERTR